MITIVLADDHTIVRQGLRSLLEAQPGLEVVGEAMDGTRAIEVVARLRPDVLIVDVMMPGLTGLEVTRQVTRSMPRTRVIVLSMHAEEAYVVDALKGGAAGYVLKDATSGDLVLAVHEVMAGRHYLSPPLSERALQAYMKMAESTIHDPLDMLTGRERQVVHLSVQGLSYPDIAERLAISPRTAESHRTNAMRKLGLRSQTDLIRFALARGIISLT